MRFTHIVPFVALLLPGIARAQGPATIHELKASPATVHRDFFDASLKPVLTIDSGDIVRLETASGNPRWYKKLGVQKDKIPGRIVCGVRRGGGRWAVAITAERPHCGPRRRARRYA